MKEYVPTQKDIEELNAAAEQISDADLKSAPLCKIAKSTVFFKTLNKSNCPDCVDMSLDGLTEKGVKLVKRINKACDYTTTKPND